VNHLRASDIAGNASLRWFLRRGTFDLRAAPSPGRSPAAPRRASHLSHGWGERERGALLRQVLSSSCREILLTPIGRMQRVEHFSTFGNPRQSSEGWRIQPSPAALDGWGAIGTYGLQVIGSNNDMLRVNSHIICANAGLSGPIRRAARPCDGRGATPERMILYCAAPDPFRLSNRWSAIKCV
jgi:hypothetical protein